MRVGAEAQGSDRLDPAIRPASRGWPRPLIGLAQGTALWALHTADHARWAERDGALWAVLLMLALFVPLIPLASLGHLRARSLAAWTLAAAGLIVLLTLYDVWRALPEGGSDPGATAPGVTLIVFGGTSLYVLHHLIEPADRVRRWRAPYADYVDTSWRHAFQLILALGFVAVLWGVLTLGQALFAAIHVRVLADAFGSGWLHAPVLGLAFGFAVDRTDAGDGLLDGVRGLGLTLLAWLLPVAAALVTLFLVSLPFTGLVPLWSTKHSAALLLGAAALLVVLVNAAYQDGRNAGTVSRVVRLAGRLSGVLLPLLVILAGWALGLRIAQHGLTPERVGGIAVGIVALLYAAGYAVAAASPGGWLRRIEPVNLVAAVTAVVVTLLALSPVADPARLSTNWQVSALASGRIGVPRFDFAALQFNDARYGRDALERLARSRDPLIAGHVRAARSQTWYGERPTQPAGHPFAQARVHPAGAMLPTGFRSQDWSRSGHTAGDTACFVSDDPCDLTVVDLNGDGVPEVVAVNGYSFGSSVLARGANGVWRSVGSYYGGGGSTIASDALAAGSVAPIAPLLPDLNAGGARMHFQPDTDQTTLPDPLAPRRGPVPAAGGAGR